MFFEEKENALIFRANGEVLKIETWGADSFRVRSTYNGEINDELWALLPRTEDLKAEISIDPENERKASIVNGRIRADLEVFWWGNLLQIVYKKVDGTRILSEQYYGGALQRRARQFTALPGGNYRLKASFEPVPGEKIYGMGQYQQTIFDLKGCNLELAHRNSQASIPFYISSIGYGFLWNNPAIGEAHFGLNSTEWTAESTKQLDYFITVGDSPKEIERNYAKAVGKTPMMPEYGLGFWQCKLRYYDQKQVLEIAREYKKRNIPIDVIVIDYYHWPRCGDWRFDEEFFPEPKKMVEELKAMGIECMVSVWPQVDWRSENYEEMKQEGLLVRSHGGIDVQMVYLGNNVFMDATNPRTRKYVWDKIRKNYYDLGIKTFWLDEAEPEFTTYEYEQYKYYRGDVLEVGNIYPKEYARMFYEGQKAAGQEGIINLIRCAWAGSQRYGALVWSGDIMSTFEDLRKQICVGIQMGIAGIPWWNSDIGGFHGGDVRTEEFKELLIRWFEFGAFCPVMRIHGSRQPHTPIINKAGEVREQTGAANEVYSYGPEPERIMTKYIRLREGMRDYLRETMKNASEKGDPVIRALFYEFPEDENAWGILDEYMFGDDLLIAPVCHAGAVKRKVYLPKGAGYTLAHTGESFAGGQEVEVSAPLDVIPVFLRDGKQEWIRKFL